MGERRALVVMTRVPEPGKTKTRMMPDLTPSQCAEFHACMLRDISETWGDAGGASRQRDRGGSLPRVLSRRGHRRRLARGRGAGRCPRA